MLSFPTVVVISSTIAFVNGRTCETSDLDALMLQYADTLLVSAQECSLDTGIKILIQKSRVYPL